MTDKYMTMQTKKINQLKEKGGEVMRTAKIVRMPDGSECVIDVFARCDWITKHNGAANDESAKWETPESAPKNGETILANIGMPWPVLTCWNKHESQWVYSSPQINMINGKYSDPYYESDYANNEELVGWMPLPSV